VPYSQEDQTDKHLDDMNSESEKTSAATPSSCATVPSEIPNFRSTYAPLRPKAWATPFVVPVIVAAIVWAVLQTI